MKEEQIKRTAAEAIVSEAEHVAKNLVENASRVASRLTDTEQLEERTTRTLADALRKVFGENEKSGRFVDVSRIPLICNNINVMHDSLKEMRDLMKEFNVKIDGLETDNNQNKGWVKGLGISIAIIIILGTTIFNIMTSKERMQAIFRESYQEAIKENTKANEEAIKDSATKTIEITPLPKRR